MSGFEWLSAGHKAVHRRFGAQTVQVIAGSNTRRRLRTQPPAPLPKAQRDGGTLVWAEGALPGQLYTRPRRIACPACCGCPAPNLWKQRQQGQVTVQQARQQEVRNPDTTVHTARLLVKASAS